MASYPKKFLTIVHGWSISRNGGGIGGPISVRRDDGGSWVCQVLRAGNRHGAGDEEEDGELENLTF